MNYDSVFKLVEPVSLGNYEPIIRDVSFGNLEEQTQFLGSCARYIGLLSPRRAKKFSALDVWEQRIAYKAETYPLEPVGITGWYSLPPFDFDRIWLGWFGVRKQYQNQGFGKRLLALTQEVIRKEFPTIKWLFLFTDDADKFYEKCGFEKLGSIEELVKAKYPGIENDTGFNLKEIVLRKKL